MRASASSSSTRTSRRRGRPLGLYGDPATRCRRPRGRPSGLDGLRPALALPGVPRSAPGRRTASPPSCGTRASSMQVWSRHEGYPGDGGYLEFHKIRWPGGLKLWRVTGAGVDLGDKEPYDPDDAPRARAQEHAAHFARLLDGIAAGERQRRGRRGRRAVRHRAVRALVVRGPRLPRRASTARSRASSAGVRPVTASRHLAEHPARRPIAHAGRLLGRQRRLQHVAQRPRPRGPGSGSGRWRRRFWDAAPVGARATRRRARCWPRPPASCCWPSRPTGSSSSRPVPRRTTPSGGFRQHCDDAESLVAALLPGAEARLADGAGAAPRSCTSATTSSPISFRPWRRRSRGSRALALG